MKTTITIPAEIHSDDKKSWVEFDALPWFEMATERSVVELAECGWCCSHQADRVALNHPDPNREIATVLDYVDGMVNMGHAKIGYEVSVDYHAAVRWLKNNRPEWACLESKEFQQWL